MRAFFLSIFFLITTSSVSYACSCGEWDFDEIDEIFYGKITRVYSPNNLLEDHGDSVYVFSVFKKWKGEKEDRLKIYDLYSCGYGLEGRESDSLIVYAFNYSFIAELLYPDYIDQEMFEKISALGFRKATTHCIYYPNRITYNDSTNKFKTLTFDEEIALLDSAFTEPVTLRPYYLNFTNLFLLIGVILAGIYVGNKNQNKKSS